MIVCSFDIDDDFYGHPRIKFGGSWGSDKYRYSFYPVKLLDTLKRLELFKKGSL